MAKPSEEDEAQEQIDRAETLLAGGDFSGAAGAFESAASLGPLSADALVSWGRALQALGLWTDAGDKWRAAIADDPQCRDAHFLLARLSLELGEFEAAVESFKAASDLDPDDADAFFGWGLALSDLERFEQARWRFDDATDRNEGFVEAWIAAGQMLFRLGQFDGAAARFSRAVDLDGNNATAWEGWADSELNQKHYEEVFARAEAALRENPSRPYVHVILGRAAYGQRKYERAAEAFDAAAELDVPAYTSSGLAHRRTEGPHAAIASDLRAFEVAERLNKARRWAGNAYTALEQYEDARRRFTDALAVADSLGSGRSDPEAVVGLGQALTYLKRYEDARQVFDQAKGHGAVYEAVSRHNTAVIFWRQGLYAKAWQEFDRARRHYEEAVEAVPVPSLRVDYGNVLLALGALSDARKRFTEAAELDPDDPGSFVGLTSVLLEERKAEAGAGSGKYWEARDPSDKARALLEDRSKTRRDVPTLLTLASLRLAMEEDDEAQSLFEEVLKLDRMSVEATSGLAAIAARRDDFRTAVTQLADVVRREPDNLTNRTSLGDVYARLELWDKAEREYRTVLSISDSHIEAHLGLGQVLLELGDTDDVLFEHAKAAFERAIALAKTMKGNGAAREGSTELSAAQISEAHYALGRAKVKLYEARMREGLFLTGRDRDLLHEALADFKEAAKDPTNHKARRAAERVKKAVDPFAPERLANEWGPRVVAGVALILLVLVQLNFFVGHLGKPIESTVYLPLSLGLLVFVIAAFYLPQLLKLKVAGIELEKSSADQIGHPQSLGIGK